MLGCHIFCKMKLSDILTIIASIIIFGLTLFISGRLINTSCFNWLDYMIMFGSLFGNLGINILSALGK